MLFEELAESEKIPIGRRGVKKNRGSVVGSTNVAAGTASTKLMRTNSADSLNQDSNSNSSYPYSYSNFICNNRMENQNRCQPHPQSQQDNIVHQNSSLQYILSPQMTKRLSNVSGSGQPPMAGGAPVVSDPLFSTIVPNYHNQPIGNQQQIQQPTNSRTPLMMRRHNSNTPSTPVVVDSSLTLSSPLHSSTNQNQVAHQQVFYGPQTYQSAGFVPAGVGNLPCSAAGAAAFYYGAQYPSSAPRPLSAFMDYSVPPPNSGHQIVYHHHGPAMPNVPQVPVYQLIQNPGGIPYNLMQLPPAAANQNHPFHLGPFSPSHVTSSSHPIGGGYDSAPNSARGTTTGHPEVFSFNVAVSTGPVPKIFPQQQQPQQQQQNYTYQSPYSTSSGNNVNSSSSLTNKFRTNQNKPSQQQQQSRDQSPHQKHLQQAVKNKPISEARNDENFIESDDSSRKIVSDNVEYLVTKTTGTNVSPIINEDVVKYRNKDIVVDYQQQSSQTTGSPRQSNRYHCGAKLELEHGRTPLFGQCPVWWGENDHEHQQQQDETASLSLLSASMQSDTDCQSKSSISSSTTDNNISTASKNSPDHNTTISDGSPGSDVFKHRRENIRMDIPFSLIEPEEKSSAEEKRRSGPSALSFTIDFAPNDLDSSTKKRNSSIFNNKTDDNKFLKAEAQWKLQSAERLKQNFLRRSMRKSAGSELSKHVKPSAPPPANQNKIQTTSKKYLLDKMLNDSEHSSGDGSPKNPQKSAAVTSKNPQNSSARGTGGNSAQKRKESADNVSDAGTYVLDQDREEELMARLKIDQVFGVTNQYCLSSSSQESLLDENYVTSGQEAVIKPMMKPAHQILATKATPSVIVEKQQQPIKNVETNISQNSTVRKSLEKKINDISRPTISSSQNVTQKSALKFAQKQLAPASSSCTIGGTFSRKVGSTPTMPAANEQQKRGVLLNELAKINQTISTTRNSPLSDSDQRKSIGSTSNTWANKKQTFSTSASARNSPLADQTSFPRNSMGRYSLKPQKSSSPLINAASAKTRASLTTQPHPKNNVSSSSGKPSTEMSMWLRRKEYNPMKAAAQARLAKMTGHQKVVEDPPYLSNRSQSFHTSSIMMPTNKHHPSTLRRHQSIEDAASSTYDVDYSDDFEDDLDDDADEETAEDIGCKYQINFDMDLQESLKSGGRFDPKSLKDITKLTEELGSHAEHLLTKLKLNDQQQKQEQQPVITGSGRITGSTGTGDEESVEAELQKASDQFSDLVRRLEFANRALEVVDNYLKNQNDNKSGGTGSAAGNEPCDPTSSSDISPSTEFTVHHRISSQNTKL